VESRGCEPGLSASAHRSRRRLYRGHCARPGVLVKTSYDKVSNKDHPRASCRGSISWVSRRQIQAEIRRRTAPPRIFFTTNVLRPSWKACSPTPDLLAGQPEKNKAGLEGSSVSRSNRRALSRNVEKFRDKKDTHARFPSERGHELNLEDDMAYQSDRRRMSVIVVPGSWMAAYSRIGDQELDRWPRGDGLKVVALEAAGGMRSTPMIIRVPQSSDELR